MKEIMIELYPVPNSREVNVFRCKPAFGNAPEPPKGGLQYGTLRNDTHRVKFAVFNAMLPLSTIKLIAHLAIESEVQKWNSPPLSA